MNDKYGNEDFWCYPLNDGREIAIWQGPVDSESIICRTSDKYDAKHIVDALIAFTSKNSNQTLNKKALSFLDFVKSKCPEPYATMAANAILWNDVEVYKKLLSDFPVIYS